MDKNKLNILRAYLDRLSADTGWYIILADYYGVLRDAAELAPYLSSRRWHVNPYCLMIKEDKGLLEQCVKQHEGRRQETENRGIGGFYKCFCGVAGYTFPVFIGGVHAITLEVAGFCAELTSKECGCIARLTNTDASEIELARSRHLAPITKDTEQRLSCYVGALAELLTGALQDVPLLGGSNEKGAQQGYVISAIDYIEKHFFEELSPCDVANHCNVSLSYLQHLFVSYTGEGIAATIRQRRMEYACELLSATDRSVRSIAIACGYYDTDYFSVAFKRIYGITPLKFRKRGFAK